jgi:translation initiation factor IF-3
VRAKKATEFLGEGHKVQIVMKLKGREKAHQDLAYKKMQNFLKIISIPVKVLQDRKDLRGFQMLITKE